MTKLYKVPSAVWMQRCYAKGCQIWAYDFYGSSTSLEPTEERTKEATCFHGPSGEGGDEAAIMYAEAPSLLKGVAKLLNGDQTALKDLEESFKRAGGKVYDV